ncbi:MAG: hypothetical protein J6V02_03365, partial [Bacteroidaceae bacterium]|nr:hypothetical protein [Bacteroidaceae bacterium]
VYEGGTRTAGEYGLGPRLFYFSPEGDFSTGLYFRGDNNTRGTATYGSFDGYRVYLQPGNYKLSYSAVGWKATGSITASVVKPSGTSAIVSKTLSVKKHLNGQSGSSVRITSSSTAEIPFQITEAGNYQLRWTLPLSSGGLYEMIIGNIFITKIEDTTQVEIIEDLDNQVVDVKYYNLNGTEILEPEKGLYIIKVLYSNGKTEIRKICR